MVSFKEHYLGLQTNQINVPQQAGFVNAFNSIGDFYGAICVAQVERNYVTFYCFLFIYERKRKILYFILGDDIYDGVFRLGEIETGTVNKWVV